MHLIKTTILGSKTVFQNIQRFRYYVWIAVKECRSKLTILSGTRITEKIQQDIELFQGSGQNISSHYQFLVSVHTTFRENSHRIRHQNR